MIKKFMTAFLALSFSLSFAMPFANSAFADANLDSGANAEMNINAQNKQMNLKEFLETTENISAKYAYPSMKLALDGEGNALLRAHTPIMIRCKKNNHNAKYRKRFHGLFCSG